MIDTIYSLTAWAIDHWPGVLVPVILLGGISLVCSATRLARWGRR